jgi:hypothetical protein
MQLRSGRTTINTITSRNLRRGSRNLDEFAERRRYQQYQQYQEQQKRIEETIYDEDDEYEINDTNNTNLLKSKIKTIFNKTKHLVYLNKFQNEKKFSYTQRIQTIMEIYELYRYNMDYLIEYFNHHDINSKRIARIIYDKGLELRVAMHKHSLKRTRSENKLYYECDTLIKFVTYMINYYILELPRPRN